MGTYNFQRIVKEIKCDMCPYRDLGINPAVLIRELQFKDCKWTVSGTKKSRVGFGYFD